MDRAKFTIAVTGGGSGGHANPAIAFIEGWLAAGGERVPEFHYIGSRAGIEARLAASRNIPYHPISTGKLRRYLSLQNLFDLARVAVGTFQAWRILGSIRPDAVFSTGGFVSVPVVAAARLRGIPVLAHEQTVSSGLANRIAGRLANRIAISFSSSAAHFPPHKVVLTGIPLRASLFEGTPSRYFERSGLDPSRPLVFVTGGAQGSRAINDAVSGALPRLLEAASVVHQCGRHASHDALSLAKQRAAGLPADLATGYRVFDYLDEGLGDLMAAATVLVGRAGAGTVCEALALALPAVLIPLPSAAGDEQRKNARLLSDPGQAVVLEERDLTSDRLASTVLELLATPGRLAAMRDAARGRFVHGAVEKLIAELEALAGLPAGARGP